VEHGHSCSVFCVCALPNTDSVNVLPKIFYFVTVHIGLLPKIIIFNVHQIPFVYGWWVTSISATASYTYM